METINDVVHFMNELIFVGHLEDNKYKNFDKIRIKLIDYFWGHVDTDSLKYLLNIIHDVKISFIDFDPVLIKNLLDDFRVRIFDMIQERTITPEVDDKLMTLEEVLEKQKRQLILLNGCKNKRKI